MRSRRTIGAAAALLLAAGVVGACGDEGSKQELSNQRAASLRSTLSDVEQSIEARDCSGAGERAAALRTQVQGLPDRVNGDLRDALEQSADRLESLIADQCRPEQAPVQEAPAGTTTEDQVQQPENDEDQPSQGKKDKKPKKEKPGTDEQPPPDTGGAEEDQGLDQQGGGTVPPGQE